MKTLLSLFVMTLSLWCTTAAAQEVGGATFYGRNVTGRTSSGEYHHRDSMVCAHRTHPFGTLLKVTNLKNDRSVIVKVNDRGPFAKGKIIDLSYGAAEKIGMTSSGTARVRLEVVGRAEINKTPRTTAHKPTAHKKHTATHKAAATKKSTATHAKSAAHKSSTAKKKKK